MHGNTMPQHGGGSTMRPSVVRFAAVLFALWLASCAGKEHLLTVKVYESQNQVVRLQAIPEAAEVGGYSHPAFLADEQIASILRGLRVEKNTSPVPLVLQRGVGHRQTAPAFSDAEVRFFAPLLGKGLAMATPEELVTFFETAEISSTQRVVTSGAVLVRGEVFHILISNHLVKKDIWIDAELYESPYRLRPLWPIDQGTEPGRLLFEPHAHMVETTTGELALRELTAGLHLHVGVRFRELPEASGSHLRTAPP